MLQDIQDRQDIISESIIHKRIFIKHKKLDLTTVSNGLNPQVLEVGMVALTWPPLTMNHALYMCNWWRTSITLTSIMSIVTCLIIIHQ